MPLTKPPYKGEINLPSRSLNLLANSLARILYEELHSEIRQNLSKEEGLASFGMRDKKVELVHPPTLPFFGKAESIQIRYVFIIG